MSHFVDLTGMRFGRLVVESRASDSPGGLTRFLCRCDCGETPTVVASNLKRGNSRSCGCLIADKTRTRNITHGATGSPEYVSWANMKDRCTRTNRPDWKWYGGRGITVCAEWLASFDAFYAEMGPRPDGHSLDRIDNDGNYEPGNCRWATQLEQVHNSRRAFKT